MKLLAIYKLSFRPNITNSIKLLVYKAQQTNHVRFDNPIENMVASRMRYET